MRIIRLSFIAAIVVMLSLAAGAFIYCRSWSQGLILTPLHRLPTQEKVVALTFDDGPSKERTPRLLSLLKKHGVNATFFMTGRHIEQYPGIARDAIRAGHLIGNHSYGHRRMIFKSPNFIRDEIERTDMLIRAAGQTNIVYFRPPYSKKFILLPLMLKQRGKMLVTGSYDPPAEYATPYNSTNVADEVIKNCTPGAIIFLHDGSDRDAEAFIDSIALMIICLKAKGYRFVTVDYRGKHRE